MEEILPAIDKSILKAELNKDCFTRLTRKGNNEIYIVNDKNAPNVKLDDYEKLHFVHQEAAPENP